MSVETTLADVERGRERLPQPPPPPPPPQTVGEAFRGFVWGVLRWYFGLLALAVLIVYACGAWGQETTIEVPQGSPVFPSVAQVDCLEDASSVQSTVRLIHL